MIKSVYYDPAWQELQAMVEGGSPRSFRYDGKTGSVEYRYFLGFAGRIDGKAYYSAYIAPRGTCSFIIEGESSAELVREFNDAWGGYCVECGIVTEYVKFDPWNPMEGLFREIYDVSLHSYNYSVDLHGDFRHDEFSSGRRYEVRRGYKRGIEVKICGREAVGAFNEVYRNTVCKYNAASTPYDCSIAFWEKGFDLFGERCVILLALKDGITISGQYYIGGKDVFHVLYAGTLPQYYGSDASVCLDDAGARYARERGFTLYDLGNGVPGSTLQAFKERFVMRSGPRESYKGTCIRNMEVYNRLVELNGRREGWFPAFIMPKQDGENQK